MDTLGGLAGPVAAVVLLAATANDLRLVLWLATIPAAAAVALLIVGVREPEAPTVGSDAARFQWRDAWKLTPPIWTIIGLTSLLALARFSEAFLLLRAAESQIDRTALPLVLAVLHAAFFLVSYPAGASSDRLGRKPLLIAGTLVLIAAHLTLARFAHQIALWVSVALWGMHMGLTQGVLASALAEHAPAHLRGSAFGVASLATGAAMLAGNALAGVTWQVWGSAWTFIIAAAISSIALTALVSWRSREPNR
jgi:MFS family permease